MFLFCPNRFPPHYPVVQPILLSCAGGQDHPHPMMLQPGVPWMAHPTMIPLDQAAYQQQAMMAAMMQNPMMATQMMFYQQQLQMMGYPHASTAAGGAILDQYIDPPSASQVAAYATPRPHPPPPQDVPKGLSSDAPGGLFIPVIDPEQQWLMQAQRGGVGLAQKPNQAIPIVPPKEK